MDPLLMDVPDRIETERLVLRVPRAGDGPILNEAIRASHVDLQPWLPWAGALPSVDESEAHCRRQRARFILDNWAREAAHFVKVTPHDYRRALNDLRATKAAAVAAE